MGLKRKFPKADPGDDVKSLMEPREDGGREWKYRGKLHRGGDLPAMETPDFSAWYRHGLMHRENGPAYISKDGKEQRYFKMGKRHREDGPAVINKDGSQQFWLNGKQLSLEEYLKQQMVLQQKLTVKRPLKLKGASPT